MLLEEEDHPNVIVPKMTPIFGAISSLCFFDFDANTLAVGR
jgi:hypothetical protein